MNNLDTFSLAYRSIRSNKLRTGITIAIIAFGIMALVGIITAIQAMNQKLMESFSTMGSNGFTIRYKERTVRFGGDNDLKLTKKNAKKEKVSNLDRPITQQEAELFIRNYKFPAEAGITAFGGNNNIISYGSEKTTPTVFLFGGDENYMDLNGFALEAGRNFSHREIETAQDLCIIGYDIATKFFPRNQTAAVNHVIRINDIPYRVIGVLASRGSTFGFSRDNLVLIGYRSMKKYFGVGNNYVIGIKTNDIHQVQNAMGEAEGLFRSIRKLNVTDESNFVLERSDSIAEKAMSVLGYLTAAIIVIGFITLIGSAIGLMNIMLVAVTERTKEVGLVKAIGGKSKAIRLQFLLESILISVLGAAFGIILGILIGNLFSMILRTGFVVPWLWIFYGILICTFVGLLAGLYPAVKAAKLNPIDALRYE